MKEDIRDLKVLCSFLLYKNANTPADEMLLQATIKRLGIRKTFSTET